MFRTPYGSALDLRKGNVLYNERDTVLHPFFDFEYRRPVYLALHNSNYKMETVNSTCEIGIFFQYCSMGRIEWFVCAIEHLAARIPDPYHFTFLSTLFKHCL